MVTVMWVYCSCCLQGHTAGLKEGGKWTVPAVSGVAMVTVMWVYCSCCLQGHTAGLKEGGKWTVPAVSGVAMVTVMWVYCSCCLQGHTAGLKEGGKWTVPAVGSVAMRDSPAAMSSFPDLSLRGQYWLFCIMVLTHSDTYCVCACKNQLQAKSVQNNLSS